MKENTFLKKFHNKISLVGKQGHIGVVLNSQNPINNIKMPAKL